MGNDHSSLEISFSPTYQIKREAVSNKQIHRYQNTQFMAKKTKLKVLNIIELINNWRDVLGVAFR